MIDKFVPGKIKINEDLSYDKDIIILLGSRFNGQQVVREWDREQKHSLCSDDLELAWRNNPEQLVVGTGHLGKMKVPQFLIDKAKNKGMSVVVRETQDCIDVCNTMEIMNIEYIAFFHLGD